MLEAKQSGRTGFNRGFVEMVALSEAWMTNGRIEDPRLQRLGK